MKLFYMLVTTIIVISCSQKELSKTKTVNANKTIDPKSLGATDKISSLNGASMVSSIEIDSPMFRINYFVVGEQDYLVGKVVALSLTLPEQADYAEILRCRNDTSFRSENIDLVTTVLTIPSAEEEAKIMRKHNFWSDAEKQTTQCELLTPGGFRGRIFYDLAAKSGSYRYLTRACVQVERLKDYQYSNRTCSKIVSLSPEFKDYKNERKDGEKKALYEVQELSSNIDGIGRELYYLATQINFAYTLCEKAEEAREAGLKRKKAFNTIMGAGLSLGSSILTPESDLRHLINGTMTVKDLLTETWGNKEAPAEGDAKAADAKAAGEPTPAPAPAPSPAPKNNMVNGSQLGQALSWLSSSAADIQKSCTSAKELVEKAKIKTLELKTKHEIYVQALADYALAKKQALGK